MSIATGIWRAGRIELQTPPPSDWNDGDEVSVVRTTRQADIDITGDSAEAIAAWKSWYQELHCGIGDSTFPEEMEQFLKQDKAEELAKWDQYCRKLDEMCP